MTRVYRGEGWVMLNLFTYIPPLFFFNTLNLPCPPAVLLLFCCPSLSHSQPHSHHHTNGTASLNRTTQRLPHSSRSYFTPSVLHSSLTPTFVPFLPSLVAHTLLPISMQNIASRVLYIYGLRLLSIIFDNHYHLITVLNYQTQIGKISLQKKLSKI